ncbi:hypothetical protein C3Y87_17490 [Carbonactinospora thermoautotrophica]|uniref:hypothetical protein n=1 Tax=Carbonactinospora thermoautotrophica TaxID=1469144 RepID=UPI002270E41B|nr:hypothetical protein [Carbonactinospora thermoautotrophica]MCX9193164.1 hypothetical protein [Carbonactinospora thermoautotrophica]
MLRLVISVALILAVVSLLGWAAWDVRQMRRAARAATRPAPCRLAVPPAWLVTAVIAEATRITRHAAEQTKTQPGTENP